MPLVSRVNVSCARAHARDVGAKRRWRCCRSIKQRIIADDLRLRRRVHMNDWRAGKPAREEAAAAASAELAREMLRQQVAHTGELCAFRFSPPAHMLPKHHGLAAGFRPLAVSALHMRALVRMGLEELARIQLGWFRDTVEVRACVAALRVRVDAAAPVSARLRCCR